MIRKEKDHVPVDQQQKFFQVRQLYEFSEKKFACFKIDIKRIENVRNNIALSMQHILKKKLSGENGHVHKFDAKWKDITG